MGKFDSYFLMNEQDALQYAREKYNFFDEGADLKCVEIGDGNLNYVFRICDQNTGKSIILKHSGIETRAKSGRLIDVDRNRIEAEILIYQGKMVKGFVPEVYGYDPVMCCCAMEDLKDYVIMRSALLNYKIFPLFADQISTYLVKMLLPSTDLAMDHKEKKKMVKRYINPDLCQITEQLVYTEPLGNFSGKNIVLDGMKEFVEIEVYQDNTLRLEGTKLKFDFMNHAQALIHGDLHSGSIFIKEDSIKVFAPEFAFFGPMGYDLGNVIAHLLFAGYHAGAELEVSEERREFLSWICSAVEDTVELFKIKFLAAFDDVATDALARTPGFSSYYLREVLADAAGTAGMELIRRVVGVSKVKDITSITSEEKRIETEKRIIAAAKRLVLDRKAMTSGSCYTELAAFKQEI